MYKYCFSISGSSIGERISLIGRREHHHKKKEQPQVPTELRGCRDEGLTKQKLDDMEDKDRLVNSSCLSWP